MTARRASVSAVGAVIGSVLLVALLVTWAASIGPGAVLTGDGPATHRAPSTQSPSDSVSGSATAGPANRTTPRADPPRLLVAVTLVLEVLLGLVVLYLVFRVGAWLVDRWRGRRRPEPPSEEIDFDVLESTTLAVTDEIVRDATRQRELLLGGTARNGIVECWHRFERQAAEAGLARRPWETSAEFTLRMLDLVAADSSAVSRFAALYREARFSDHPLDEHARSDAVAALDEIHAGLRALTGRRS
jgi:uncharacterized protein DUF4129